jgi:3',5'-cyclic AMP phosphodiesterase CpdA
MTLVLQMSDPHFGTERPMALAALERLCGELRPDVLLITGDITQRARPIEFSRARAFVDKLGIPARLVIPGNHDIPLYALPTRLLHPYQRYERAFGPVRDDEFETDDLLLIALNTTRRYRHKNGELSERQIERTAQRLAAARAGQVKLVAVHQPVAVTRASDLVNLLRGHAKAARRWAEAGVDAIVGGHIHLPYVLPLHERRPDRPRPVWAVQAGTALSTRVRGGIPNSVNLIRTEQGQAAVVERWDVDETVGLFQRVSSTPLT